MGSVSEIADAELIRRVVYVLNTKKRGKKFPLWEQVSKHFLLGSTYSAQLCRRFGLDPDRQVGSS